MPNTKESFMKEIDEISKFKDGWKGKKSKAINKEKLEPFLVDFYKNIPQGFKYPNVYLTVDGGLLMEWKCKTRKLNYDVTTEIDFDKQLMIFEDGDVYEEIPITEWDVFINYYNENVNNIIE